MLEFNAVTFKNNSTPLAITSTTLPVEVKDGQFKVGPKEILVKVHAAALNPVDLILKNSMPSLIFRGDKGFGMDYSGDVAAIGAAAAAQTGFAIGDRVAGLLQDVLGQGTIAEYILINPFNKTGKSARKMPQNLSYQEAAAYPLVFGTAQQLFDQAAKGNAYKKILIIGAGTSVGRYCVQLAKNSYHATDIVVTCSGRLADAITELGATSIIDYTQHKSILNPVLELVKESGKFDLILDCCGNGDLFSEMLHILKGRSEGGTYNTVTGDNKSKFTNSFISIIVGNVVAAVRQVRSLLGLLPYHYRLTLLDNQGPWPDACAENVASGKYKIFIDSEYPMERTQEAADRLLTNKAVGKVVVTI